MPLDFEKQAQKGNKFLKDVAVELGNKAGTEKAGRMVKAVFYTLRNHLTLEENFKLLSQLPIALKGVYIHEWSLGKRRDVSRKKLILLKKYLPMPMGHPFMDCPTLKMALKRFMQFLKL